VLKKTITYENPFTEQQETEEHYFHISKADLVEMEMEEHAAIYVKDGETLTGMRAKLQKIVDSNDGRAIMAEFKDIIRRSYGRKDGDRFLKSKTAWEDFEASEAFSQLLFELCTDPSAAADFVNGIVPGNLEQVAAEVREQAAETTAATEAKPESRILTTAEIVEMDSDELKSGLATGKYKLS
jgi:hypothetical protein